MSDQNPPATAPPPGPYSQPSAAAPVAPPPSPYSNGAGATPSASSPKSFIATWLLSWLLGIFGADRFYRGKIGTAIIKLLTLGGWGVWWLIDLIITLTGNATDQQGFKIRPEGKQGLIAWIVTGAAILLGLVFGAVSPKSAPVLPPPSAQAPATPGDSAEEPENAASAAPEEEEPAPEPAPSEEPPVPEEPEETVSQQNAIRSAEEYLAFAAFSRQGLIDQLEFEGYPTEDATYAVDNIDVDWNEQAAQAAADYLDFTAFSRQGLIDQLEFEGFTAEQAEYGVNSVGL